MRERGERGRQAAVELEKGRCHVGVRWPAAASCLVVLAACLAIPLVAQDQKPVPPAFRTEAELVIVDAVIVDRSGQPVTDLTAGDFEVFDEGARQDIQLFQAVSTASAASLLGGAPPAVRRLPYSTNVGTSARATRAFVLFFDDVHLTREEGERSKSALTAFLERETRDGDLVSLVAPGQALRWHARMPDGRAELKRTVSTLKGSYLPDLSFERMSDYEAYRIHVFQDEAAAERVDRRWQNLRVLGREPADLANDRGFRPENRGGNIGIIKQDIAIRAAALYAQLAARNRATLLALERTVDALASVRGRKALVLVSPGFIEDHERREASLVLDAARRANVAIYFVDARGLVTGSPYAQAQFGSAIDARDVGAANADSALEAEGAETLSSGTGGFSVRNSNDLTGALRRISRESEVYYLLGFRPGDTGRPGAFRKIAVRVTRPGVQVRARAGYYVGGAPVETKDAARATADDLSRAADSPYDLTAIPLRASAYVFGETSPGRALTLLAVEADLRAFALAREPAGTLGDTLQLRVLVTEQSTGSAERYERDVAMTFPATARFDTESWRSEVAEFRLGPGRYQARFAVRDRNSGAMGAVTHEFEVPALDGFRVTTPIVTDTIEAPTLASQSPPKPVLLVRRVFPAGAIVYYQFTVLGAATRAAGGAQAATGGSGGARVTASHEVRRADGTVVKRMEPRLMVPGREGGLSRFSSISMAGAPEGDYELVLRVTDEIAGRSIELHEPFGLASPTGANGAR